MGMVKSDMVGNADKMWKHLKEPAKQGKTIEELMGPKKFAGSKRKFKRPGPPTGSNQDGSSNRARWD